MPTIMNPHHLPHREIILRTSPQKVAIGMGIVFLVIGFVGVMFPGFLEMHLSVAHNLIHIFSGALALWCGYSKDTRAYNFCLFFGAFYGLLGIAGFVIGSPGFPALGHMEADQNLFRVIPNILEFGSMDHIVHLLIATFLILTAYTFRKERTTKRVF